MRCGPTSKQPILSISIILMSIVSSYIILYHPPPPPAHNESYAAECCNSRADSALLSNDIKYFSPLCLCFVCKGQKETVCPCRRAAGAPGTPLKTARWGPRDKKTWKGDVGTETREGSCYKAYGLFEETDAVVGGWRWEHTRPVAIPQRDQQADVCRLAGTLRAQPTLL